MAACRQNGFSVNIGRLPTTEVKGNETEVRAGKDCQVEILPLVLRCISVGQKRQDADFYAQGNQEARAELGVCQTNLIFMPKEVKK